MQHHEGRVAANGRQPAVSMLPGPASASHGRTPSTLERLAAWLDGRGRASSLHADSGSWRESRHRQARPGEVQINAVALKRALAAAGLELASVVPRGHPGRLRRLLPIEVDPIPWTG